MPASKIRTPAPKTREPASKIKCLLSQNACGFKRHTHTQHAAPLTHRYGHNANAYTTYAHACTHGSCKHPHTARTHRRTACAAHTCTAPNGTARHTHVCIFLARNGTVLCPHTRARTSARAQTRTHARTNAMCTCRSMQTRAHTCITHTQAWVTSRTDACTHECGWVGGGGVHCLIAQVGS